MSLISNPSELILIYRGMQEPKKAAKYDLMLTPQFYIVKEEKLPVKYAFQAKKLAPSILDEFIDNDKNYQFIVEKIKDGWRFYAYSPLEIESFLKTYNIEPNKINKIYFAEQISNILAKVPILLDDNNALVLLDSKATIVPKDMLETETFAQFNKKMKPKKGYKFKSSSTKSVNSDDIDKTTIIIALLLILISIAFIVDALSYKKATKELENKLLTLYNEAPTLRSKLAREAIKKKYQKIEDRQRSIREQLKNFSQLSSKKSILDSLTLNKNNLEANFRVEKSELKRIKAITANTSLKYEDRGNGLLNIQGALK